MEKISKFKRYLEIAEQSLKLPDMITITDVPIEKEIYISEKTFLPVIAVYSNFLSRLLIEEDIFKLQFKKSESALFFLSIADNKNAIETNTNEVLKILILTEALEQLFPKNARLISAKNYYDEVITQWRETLSTIEENKTIDPVIVLDKLIKDSLYVNLLDIKNKLQNKNG